MGSPKDTFLNRREGSQTSSVRLMKQLIVTPPLLGQHSLSPVVHLGQDYKEHRTHPL